MKVNVKFKIIKEICQGQSKATGNPWISQDVIVSWPDSTPDGRVFDNVQTFTLHGQNVEKFAELGIKEGMEMIVDLRFKTREFNNRVYNDNNLYII